jgi:hypothetical protein
MEKHVPAFKESISVSKLDKPFQHIPKLYEFENDKRFIVRKAEEYQFEKGQFTTLEETVKTLKSLFDELRQVYGIEIPAQFVIAEDENKKASLYTLIDRISPVGLETLDADKKHEAVKGIETIFEALVSYYKKKVATDENFLSDLPEVEQYIYGTKDGEVEARWYMVDTDPYFSNDRQVLYDTLDTLNEELPDIENDFGVDMTVQKKRVEELMKGLEEHPE